MTVMSADGSNSSLTAALEEKDAPVEGLHAAAAPANGTPARETSVESSQASVPSRSGRLTAISYAMLIVGTIFVCILPRFRLSPGLAEEGVALLGIVTVLAGALLAIWSFVKPLLRRG
jgi:hypothetical protein